VHIQQIVDGDIYIYIYVNFCRKPPTWSSGA